MQRDTNLPKHNYTNFKTCLISWEISHTLEINHLNFEVDRKSELRNPMSELRSSISLLGSRSLRYNNIEYILKNLLTRRRRSTIAINVSRLTPTISPMDISQSDSLRSQKLLTDIEKRSSFTINMMMVNANPTIDAH